MREKVAHVNDIPEGKAKLITLKNGVEIALFHCRNQFFALGNECPHMGAPLAEGELNSCTITCPWHGWQFDVTSGVCTDGGWENAISYKVEVINEFIYIDSENL